MNDEYEEEPEVPPEGYFDPTVPTTPAPFKEGEIVEVAKTHRSRFRPQQVKITRLWWGSETGQWCALVVDAKNPDNDRPYATFCDTLRYPPVAQAAPPASPTA